VERLRAAGVEVITGVREAEGDELVADFAMLMREGRPLTVLKGASTLDGKIASRTGDSKWITGEPARAEGHALRAECGAVMVGVGTVLADDPRLDVRMVTGRDPIRIVLDTQLRTPPTAKVIAHESSAPTWVVHGPLDEVAMVARAAQLRREGVELVEAPVAAGTLDLPAVLRLLGQRGVMRLLVEGGARVHGALIETGLADRGVFFVAPLVLGDRQARSLVERASPPDTIAAASRLRVTGVRTVGVDVRIDARFERG
jgi:diaminohydroxyphosphoribosylaminopyrimidine deaminase/5-amino-6-(5-phosphoribosylamino)uracil reductase